MVSAAADTRQRVLLVDDDPTLLEVLTTVLHLEDLEVIPASGGEAALKIAADGGVDLVICDVGMLDPDGREVCRRLKTDPGTRDLPVILLTGRDTDEDRSRGEDAGCDASITKPFSPLELLELIRGERTGDRGGVPDDGHLDRSYQYATMLSQRVAPEGATRTVWPARTSSCWRTPSMP